MRMSGPWHIFRSILASLALLGMSGCAMRSGPKTIPRGRFDYSAAIHRSWKEQTLLNVVKIRYMDSPMFMDVQQVVAQYTFERAASINGFTGGADPGSGAASMSGRWAESPTITYAPMSGEKFTKSLLRPVDPATLFGLVEGGLPIDLVFGAGVKVINGLHSGSQTELLKRTGDLGFYQVLALLRELQNSDEVALRIEEKQGGNVILVLRNKPAKSAAALELRRLLHLSPDAEQFKFGAGAAQTNDKEIVMLTRSMLEIMAETSAGVEIPESDLNEGRAVRMDIGGAPSDLGRNVRLRVRSTVTKPNANEAFAAVQYRNHWFWVDDRDLNSKRGLGFLMILFTLAESGTSPTPPLLTVSKP